MFNHFQSTLMSFPFQHIEHDWMWLAAFFIHAPAITILLESCLVLLNHPHRPAKNNSLEPRRKPSKTFSRTSWHVWYECNLKQQIECYSCSLLQFLRCFTFPHTHTHSVLVQLAMKVSARHPFSFQLMRQVVSRQPHVRKNHDTAWSENTTSWRNKKWWKNMYPPQIWEQPILQSVVKTLQKLTWPMDVLDALGSEKPMQPKFLSSGPKLFASLLGRWPLLDPVILTNCPSNEQALALVPEACLDFGCEVGPCRRLKYASVQRFPRRTRQLLQLSVGALRKPFTIPPTLSECRHFGINQPLWIRPTTRALAWAHPIFYHQGANEFTNAFFLIWGPSQKPDFVAAHAFVVTYNG